MYTRLERLEVKYNLLHSNVNFIDRLKHFFVDLAKAGESNNGNEVTVNIQITHMEISRYLHCSRQSITTALSSLRQAGCIDYSRTSIKIIDLKKIIDWKLK
jgi:CRP-like cAMP-binding protein